MYREVSGSFLWRISRGNYAIRQFYAKRCRILCRAKRALFGFDVKFGCVVDECRPAKGCIKKWVHGSANGQLELSTTEEVNGKNMEKSTMEKLKIRFHDETNDLDYVPVGDYYLPDLTLDEQLSAHC